MARDSRIEHLLRRAGFGASAQELDYFVSIGFEPTLDWLLDAPVGPDKLHTYVGNPAYVGVATRAGQFSPNTVIGDARQWWLFRMLHSVRPLQEKMTLFWHNHFATAYSKISDIYTPTDATRLLAARPASDPARQKGQLELFREHSLGNFRDLLVAVAKDPAMLIWLDGRLNVRSAPQENFARELMELFTLGVGRFVEQDVYAGARVFTGWNLRRTPGAPDGTAAYEFFYNPNNHEPSAKTFSFSIYPDGGRTIPARTASDGLQDGLDLIDAVARHPETGRRLAGKLYQFFVNEIAPPDQSLIDAVAATYYRSNFSISAMVEEILRSPQFSDPSNYFARYSWPAEFVVRAIKEVGWTGYSVNDPLLPMSNMGQVLLDPLDVNGWELGTGWINTSAMLARMNFAASLAQYQRFNLRDAARTRSSSARALVDYCLDRVRPADLDTPVYDELLNYVNAGGAWSATEVQLLAKPAGLVHLILGTAEYQFN